ncbi:Uncharacterized protein FWK35_00021566, partial [Aphis craccivora]
SDSKVNILVFKKIEKNKKKVTEKREFLPKTSIRPNRFFLYGCNSKTNHCKYLKFSPNVPYEFTNFYEICRKRQNLQFLIIQILTKIRQNHEYLQIILNLNFAVFRPLKHKPSFPPTTGNYILG